MSEELNNEEKHLLHVLAKPKYDMKYIEDHFIAKGMNPFARHMKEDHARCEERLRKEFRKE